MNKLIFKPEDFNFLRIRMNDSYEHEAARRANEALERMLSECTVVYAGAAKDRAWFDYRTEKEDTHKAIIVNIEEIKPKVCEHEPKFIEGTGFGAKIVLYANECAKCGKKLEATWEEVE